NSSMAGSASEHLSRLHRKAQDSMSVVQQQQPHHSLHSATPPPPLLQSTSDPVRSSLDRNHFNHASGIGPISRYRSYTQLNSQRPPHHPCMDKSFKTH
ncbi:Uncharacterized protein FKW44_023583, partial [Caligus rogercresseyi]